MIKSGIIYKIYDRTDKKLVYYGSTEKLLSERLDRHLYQYKYWKDGNYRFITSFLVIDADDYDITVVERVEFDDKKELFERERFYIENNICVNERIPYRTPTERYEANAEYYKENKDKIAEQRAEYKKVNKVKISEQNAAYRKVNKDKIAEWYQENKAKINEKFSCICGGSYTYINKSRHENSIKHKKYIASCASGK